MPKQPNNQNFLATSRFQLVFSKIPLTPFFCQTVTVPGINLGETNQPTPFLDIPTIGDKLNFEPMVINCFLNEDMENYIELLNWLEEVSSPDVSERGDYSDLYSDATIITTTNIGNPNIEIQFFDCFPTNVSSFVLNYSEESNPIFFDITLTYSRFKIKKIGS